MSMFLAWRLVLIFVAGTAYYKLDQQGRNRFAESIEKVQ